DSQDYAPCDYASRGYAPARTMQPITGFRISSMGRREVDVTFPNIVSYGIQRREFDEYLLRRCGAQVREGVPITSIERVGDAWLINGETRARMLIGAGGHFCPIARALNSGRNGNTNGNHDGSKNGKNEEPVVAQEIEFAMSPDQAAQCRVQGETPELYFCEDLKGYGWCFRKGNLLNIGLGRLDQRALPDHVARFLEFLRAAGKVPFDLPGRLSGHAYLVSGYTPRKIVGDHVLLIGDSAGLAFPQSGEGIWPAVESGLIAAGVVESAAGDYSLDRLQKYPALLTQRLGASGGILQSLGRRLPSGLRKGIARWLLTKPSFCRHTVVENWFLHAA
ncbi:MAG: NAD(P)/FAD-dependent oxidoreductase, partial [Terriglobales bacterium]